MGFSPKPLTAAEMVPVELALSKMVHDHLVQVGAPHGLSVAEVIRQYLEWSVDTKQFGPAKKRTGKPKKA